VNWPHQRPAQGVAHRWDLCRENCSSAFWVHRRTLAHRWVTNSRRRSVCSLSRRYPHLTVPRPCVHCWSA